MRDNTHRAPTVGISAIITLRNEFAKLPTMSEARSYRMAGIRTRGLHSPTRNRHGPFCIRECALSMSQSQQMLP